MNGIVETPTMSSSDSPPYGNGSSYQDRYAPPDIRAAHERDRQMAAAAAAMQTNASTLGRRSRKHLNLDDDAADSQSEMDVPQRSRRRLDTWEADGKENMRVNGDAAGGRIRKRGADSDDELDEQEGIPSKARRKVDANEDAQDFPGAFRTQTAPDVAASGKRKDRDEGDALDDDDDEEPPSSGKQTKRVRITSRLPSATLVGDTEMVHAEPVEAPELEKLVDAVRKPGEEWEEDGIKYKMGPKGQLLREAYVKERNGYNSVCVPALSI